MEAGSEVRRGKRRPESFDAARSCERRKIRSLDDEKKKTS